MDRMVRLDRARLARVEQGLVKAAVRPLGEDRVEQQGRAGLRMRRRGQVIGRSREVHVAWPPQRHGPLAFLRRFDGVPPGPGPRGRGEGREELADPFEDLGAVEAPADEQHRVVRLIMRLVEGLQASNRDVLDVGLGADGWMSIVEPMKHRSGHGILEREDRIARHGLELIADHRHFHVQKPLLDSRVEHAVGFHFERPAQVRDIACRERLIIIGPLEVGGGVPVAGTRLVGKILPDARKALGSLDGEVLEEVGGAGLAVVLVRGSHEVGDVDRHGLPGWFGIEQDPQAVGQAVLGDPLDGSDVSRLDGGE